MRSLGCDARGLHFGVVLAKTAAIQTTRLQLARCHRSRVSCATHRCERGTRLRTFAHAVVSAGRKPACACDGPLDRGDGARSRRPARHAQSEGLHEVSNRSSRAVRFESVAYRGLRHSHAVHGIGMFTTCRAHVRLGGVPGKWGAPKRCYCAENQAMPRMKRVIFATVVLGLADGIGEACSSNDSRPLRGKRDTTAFRTQPATPVLHACQICVAATGSRHGRWNCHGQQGGRGRAIRMRRPLGASGGSRWPGNQRLRPTFGCFGGAGGGRRHRRCNRGRSGMDPISLGSGLVGWFNDSSGSIVTSADGLGKTRVSLWSDLSPKKNDISPEQIYGSCRRGQSSLSCYRSR